MTGQSSTHRRTDLATSDGSLRHTTTQLPAACAHPSSPARAAKGKRCGTQAAQRGDGSHDLSSRRPYQNKRPAVRYFGITRSRVPSVVDCREGPAAMQRTPGGDRRRWRADDWHRGTDCLRRAAGTTGRCGCCSAPGRSPTSAPSPTRYASREGWGCSNRPSNANGPTPSNTPSSQPCREWLPHRVGHDAPAAPSATDPGYHAFGRFSGRNSWLVQQVRRRSGSTPARWRTTSSRRFGLQRQRLAVRFSSRMRRTSAGALSGTTASSGRRSGLSLKRCRRRSRTAVVVRQESAPA